jgi:bifunctional non-homologous end joining protein LigD
MGLETYRRKRHFNRTSEPRGRKRRSPKFLSFTIQRHHATRLHYDFRLELDGVLKSWAVPKGPCFDPEVRRLAVQVEDHPVEYGAFEGSIPAGEYGAGTVVLWDRGSWTPLGDPREGLEKGHLRFSLDGHKLKGRWDLVRLRRGGGEAKTNWLLIKARDEEARPSAKYDITQARPESVSSVSARKAKRIWHSDRSREKAGPRPKRTKRPVSARLRAPRNLPGAKKGPLPDAVEPELCTLVERPPDGDDWLHEMKLDGYRIIATVAHGKVTLRTRRGNDWTEQFSPIAAALSDLPLREAILDGEVTVLDASGVSRFQALQNVLSRAGRGQLVYYAFDLLHVDGWDVRGVALEERKRLLAAVLEGAPPCLRYADHVEGRGPDFFAKACENGLEGVVSKRRDSVYVGARTRQWLKSKCLQRQEFVVVGFTAPGGTRRHFGALLLGVREGAKLRFVGRVGTGFDDKTLASMMKRLAHLERRDAPVENPPTGAQARGVRWVEPSLVAEIGFSEWTDEGILRQPRYLGLREDKPAGEVRREEPLPKLTNPDRVLYAAQGVTKADLARYYEQVGETALKYLARRPLSLVRCPRGQGAHCFFQKHMGEERPPALRSVDVVEKGVPQPYVYVDDLAGLLSLVQLGVLEIHPWGSTVGSLEQPDVMTFDLDPAPDVRWDRMIAAAQTLRARLTDLGLVSFLKTTGGKGLHVVVPIKPEAVWERVKDFSKQVVELLARAEPALYTTNMAKAKRPGKIFLDYLRNGRGATAVGAYSSRAKPGATVAAPLAWDELTPKLRPDRFTVRDVPARLRASGDPWRGYFEVDQSVR